jgi:flagellar basal-body rod protein FlgC
MNPFADISAIVSSGLRAQGFRLRVVSENLANADTHGYRRKLVTFDNAVDKATGAKIVRVDRVSLDRTEGERIYDPVHPLADKSGYVVMSNVNMMTEIADAREANRSYEAGLQIIRQAREMYAGLIEILRR